MKAEDAPHRPASQPENLEPPDRYTLRQFSAPPQERRREKRAKLREQEEPQENLTARYWG